MAGASDRSRAPRPRTVPPVAAHYLEVIYYLRQEGKVPRPTGLATWLGVAAPTVSQGLARLVRDGLVVIEPDHRVVLTETGEEIASSLVRKHRILERWLVDDLGLDWVSSDDEAERLAPTISDAVLQRLYEHLDYPTTCPHGNEVPGSAPRQGPPSVPLLSLPSGVPAVIVRITELAEHEAPAVLRELESLGLVPGAHVSLRAGVADPDLLEVETDGSLVLLARSSAEAVVVAESDDRAGTDSREPVPAGSDAARRAGGPA